MRVDLSNQQGFLFCSLRDVRGILCKIQWSILRAWDVHGLKQMMSSRNFEKNSNYEHRGKLKYYGELSQSLSDIS